MNFNFFEDTKAAYISVNNAGFLVNGKIFQTIQCFIREIRPVRKLFKGRKIECYSNDAKKSKSGEFCALCPKRMQCKQRIRLMLLIQDKDQEGIPAQLEINSNSFEPLKKILEPIKTEELPTLLVNLAVKTQDKYLQIQFNTVF